LNFNIPQVVLQHTWDFGCGGTIGYMGFVYDLLLFPTVKES